MQDILAKIKAKEVYRNLSVPRLVEDSLLKKEVAKTGFGNIVTQKNTLYNSANIPFLKLYDTRGI